MKKPVYIEYLDCYIPETKMHLADCSDLQDAIGSYFMDGEDFLKFFHQVLALEDVRVERKMDLETMAMLVVDQYVHRRRADPRTVKYIIIATDQSASIKDFGHNIMQKLASPRTTVLRVGDNYCANIDIAIGLAATLLRTEQEPARA